MVRARVNRVRQGGPYGDDCIVHRSKSAAGALTSGIFSSRTAGGGHRRHCLSVYCPTLTQVVASIVGGYAPSVATIVGPMDCTRGECRAAGSLGRASHLLVGMS